ncbi:MAG: glycosyltransferase family 1 protein [Deltaproteobacteria bacterium]|nr:glycosyltransferase family 1 protein [Deltaproteobacteria bacterium]TLN02899.1 MAG: glycosyltransferase family 1 protein [bacterium]
MDLSKKLHRFTVVPSLPQELSGLHTIAYNLWWTWEPQAIELFRRVDLDLWKETHHNPVKMLGSLQQSRIEELLADDGFMAHLRRVEEMLREYMEGKTWYEKARKADSSLCVAYFSMEFGLHESIPIYSGGLGVLSGDHLKSASDLGIPLLGVGLLYRHGYFRQYLNIEGWQQEIYPENDFYNMPLRLERDSDGTPRIVSLEIGTHNVKARIWRVQVGRVPLYLLDTSLEENAWEDRKITSQLYGGNQEMRIKQELLLGIGGLRALKMLGIEPEVCHMNEGHAAFLALERIRVQMKEENLSFSAARELTIAGTVFTTHTPVEAGIDHFEADLVDAHLGHYYQQLGLSRDEFLSLGRQNPKNQYETFCMAVLALRLAGHYNGVSKLHGQVSRKMWKNIWPDLPEEQLPLTSITNGVHTRTWLSEEMASLLIRYFGTRWLDDPSDYDIWKKIHAVPDAELWRTHERCRERLVTFARKRLKEHLRHVGSTSKEIVTADETLDPEILTIGFARRFATYKRGTLLLRDLDRLDRILNNPTRPVQIVFAGKAHPADFEGKELIRQIQQVALQERFRHRIVFIEDYDLAVARRMVQGVDVWLNTPRRPLEASGTSGMKVAFNGGLNMSVLDGWWPEGYRGNNGWAIGKGEVYGDIEYQNEIESRAIYDLLEKEVVPLFYDRGTNGIPRGWLACMKASIETLCPVFSTERMLQEYTDRFYLSAFEQWIKFSENKQALARDIALWKEKMRRLWHKVRVEGIEASTAGEIPVRTRVQVQARIGVGEIPLDELSVKVYFGNLNAQDTIIDGEFAPLHPVEQVGTDLHRFSGEIECRSCGRQAFVIQVMPKHPQIGAVYEQGLILWV